MIRPDCVNEGLSGSADSLFSRRNEVRLPEGGRGRGIWRTGWRQTDRRADPVGAVRPTSPATSAFEVEAFEAAKAAYLKSTRLDGPRHSHHVPPGREGR